MNMSIRGIVELIINIYIVFLMVRIIGSWFPNFSRYKLMRFVAYYADPYLNVFRRMIPPIGKLDLTPMFAYFGLCMIRGTILSILHLFGLC